MKNLKYIQGVIINIQTKCKVIKYLKIIKSVYENLNF